MAKDMFGGLNKKGVGEVIPPHLARPVDSIDIDVIEVAVVDVKGENDGLFQRDAQGRVVMEKDEPVPAISDHYGVFCEYPKDYKKCHQVAIDMDPEHLVAVIRKNLQGRYGVGNTWNLETKLPAKLADMAGVTLKFTRA